VEDTLEMAAADVLVVEDDSDLRNALTWLFEDERIPLRLAANGSEALSLIAASTPALVLLDLSMPGMSAEELVSRLRAQMATARIPIIVLSAARDVTARAEQLGAQGAIAKPYDLDALLAAVREHISPNR
jgi:DNA-binding response OmpR family regulator